MVAVFASLAYSSAPSLMVERSRPVDCNRCSRLIKHQLDRWSQRYALRTSGYLPTSPATPELADRSGTRSARRFQNLAPEDMRPTRSMVGMAGLFRLYAAYDKLSSQSPCESSRAGGGLVSAVLVAPPALACPWKDLSTRGIKPPSWEITERRFEAKAAGAIVLSFAKGAVATDVNAVFWDWAPDPPHQVRGIDDDQRLPKGASSWRSVEQGRARPIETRSYRDLGHSTHESLDFHGFFTENNAAPECFPSRRSRNQ
jgi:hypothetical protein